MAEIKEVEKIEGNLDSKLEKLCKNRFLGDIDGFCDDIIGLCGDIV